MRVGFSRNRGAFSRVIRLLDGGPSSHVYVSVPLPDGERMVSHAQGMNVHYVYGPRFENANEVVEEYDVEISPEQEAIAKYERWVCAGVPYGWGEILGYLWVLACRAAGRRVRNPMADGNGSHVCVGWVLNQLGWYHVADRPESWTVEDLRREVVRVGVRVR